MPLSDWLFFVARMVVEASLLVAAAWVVERFASPALQRMAWRAAVVGLLLLVAVEIIGVRDWLWSREATAPFEARNMPAEIGEPASLDLPAGAGDATAEPPTLGARRTGFTWLPLMIWGASSLLFMGRVAYGLARVRVAARFTDIGCAEWPAGLAELCQAIGVQRLRVLSWPSLRTPAAFGFARPTVALPADFQTRWPRSAQDAVLAHELAHLAAHDPVWNLLAEVVAALLFWQPAAWLARRRLREASERAADEVSARLPGGALALAEVLVRCARELPDCGRARGMGIAGDRRKSHLARRVVSLLAGQGATLPLRGSRLWCGRIASAGALGGFLMAPWPGGEGPSVAALLHRTAAGTAPSSAASPVKESPSTDGLGAVGRPIENPPVPPQPSGGGGDTLAPRGQQVRLKTRFVEVTEQGAGELGFDWLFGQSPTNNPGVVTNGSRAALGLPGAETNTNLRVEAWRTTGQAASLSGPQFAALADRLSGTHKGVVTANQTVVALSGKRARIQTTSAMTVVAGVQAQTSKAGSVSVIYQTAPISVGATVEIQPEIVEGGWRLGIVATATEFEGYDDPGTNQFLVSVGGAQPLTAQIPLPHFRIRTVDGEVIARAGETVALRGPMVETVTRTVDKVPILGDIPVLGRLFRRDGKQVDRKRLYVFVSPEEPANP